MEAPTNRAGRGNFLGDHDLEEIEIAEEDLIDAYVRGELSLNERKLVEKGLRSSPRLVERLHFARMLAYAAARVPESETSSSSLDNDYPTPRKPWWQVPFGLTFVQGPAFQLILAACALMFVIGTAGLLAGLMKVRGDSQRLASERAALEQQRRALEKRSAEQQSRSDQLTAELAKEKQQQEQDRKLIEELRRSQNEQSNLRRPTATLASFFLLPGLTRDVRGGNELNVAPGAAKIRLKLGLEANDYTNYRAVIKNPQGSEIFHQSELKPRASRLGKLVAVQLPARRLPPGDYTLSLSGVTSSGAAEPVGDYAFRITTKEK